MTAFIQNQAIQQQEKKLVLESDLRKDNNSQEEVMKGSITAAIALALVTSSAAFAPAAPFVTKSTALSAEAEKKELVLDTNFDDVNIVRLLGLKRVKKMIRKSKTNKNKEE